MTNIHGVFGVFVEFLGGLALLGFLSKDTDPAFGHILQQPGMDDIQTVICISFCPTMPGKAARLAINGGLEFGDFRLDGEAEGFEAEAGVGGKYGAFGIVELDVCYVVVVGFPYAGVDKILEDVFGGDALDDYFVGSEVISSAGQIVMGPIDFI